MSDNSSNDTQLGVALVSSVIFCDVLNGMTGQHAL